MNELIAFIRRNSRWFVFTIYIVLGLMLLFQSNPFQHRVFLTSANSVSTAVYNIGNQVTSYFNLRTANDELNARNAELLREVTDLRNQVLILQEKTLTDTLVIDSTISRFRFIVAHVINNSVSKPYNYITINKGEADGIRPEMGVIDRNGVVGIVSNVGTRSSRVISLLNPNFRLSCKIKGSDVFGSLVWDGDDPTTAMLEELPRHTVFKAGDTIVTSGYSAVFPAGLPVGRIISDGRKHQENFFTLKIKLFSDFSTLNNVQVVVDAQKEEIQEVESVTETSSSPYDKKPVKSNAKK